MNANLRNFVLWVVIVLLLLALFTLFQNPGQRATSQEIPFSQFLDEVDRGTIRAVVINGTEIRAATTQGRNLKTNAPYDPTLEQRLRAKGVVITAAPPPDTVPWLVSLLISWLPFLVLIGVWLFLTRWTGGKSGNAFGFGKRAAGSARIADDPASWRIRAGEAQAAAEQLADPLSKRRMLEIAHSYEYLAQRAEDRLRGAEQSR